MSGLAIGVKAIAAGGDHTCAVTSEGGVRCWGENDYGQLGDGSTVSSAEPVDVPGVTSGVEAIAAGYSHTCALMTEGGVRCWGRNDYGQLGDGSTTNDVSGLGSDVKSIVAGFHHTCAVTSEGGVRCWGLNMFGQLGDDSTDSSTEPVDASGLTSGVAAITAGGYYTCALTTSGGVRCWGENSSGQLGDGSTTSRSTPVAIGAGQSIVFLPPTTAPAGMRVQLDELALASSGLQVTFDTWTPDVCTVSGTTLEIELLPDGDESALCGVIARQPGRQATMTEGGSIAPAPAQPRIISIVKE